MKIPWIWREFYLIFKTLLNSLNLQICSKSLKNNSKKILYFEKMPCCEKNHRGQIIHGLEYTERKILIFILKYVFLLSCKVSKIWDFLTRNLVPLFCRVMWKGYLFLSICVQWWKKKKNCGWLIMYVIILLNVYDSIYFRVIFPHFNCENIFNYLRLIYNRRSIS